MAKDPISPTLIPLDMLIRQMHPYVVSVVSRYMANPEEEHWKAVQWIFRYLHGSSDICLYFGGMRDGVIGYVDSDFAGDLDKRRSLTGYAFTIRGYAICWKSTLLTTFTLLTTKAEYMDIIEAYEKAILCHLSHERLDVP